MSARWSLPSCRSHDSRPRATRGASRPSSLYIYSSILAHQRLERAIPVPGASVGQQEAHPGRRFAGKRGVEYAEMEAPPSRAPDAGCLGLRRKRIAHQLQYSTLLCDGAGCRRWCAAPFRVVVEVQSCLLGRGKFVAPTDCGQGFGTQSGHGCTPPPRSH